MTYARAHLVDADSDGFYHCISRCVRRAWLCGTDPNSGRSFDHRRQWMENRLLLLAEVFCIDVFGFAVMSNHYHLVAQLRPQLSQTLPDHEVAERWARLGNFKTSKDRDEAIARHLDDNDRLDLTRARLGSLSWFMRYLNEPMARIANIEDDCKGRFWEGRFKSFALLDEAAVLAAMVYVDLNPWRANLAQEPQTAPHTSVARRVKGSDQALAPLEQLGLQLDDYINIVRWTALPHASDSPIADPNLSYSHHQWCHLVQANRHKYRAYGPVEALKDLTTKLAQKWMKGARIRKPRRSEAMASHFS